MIVGLRLAAGEAVVMIGMEVIVVEAGVEAFLIKYDEYNKARYSY